MDIGVRPAGRRLTLRVTALALAPGLARDQLALPIFKSLQLLTSLLSSLALDSYILGYKLNELRSLFDVSLFIN